jgi:hypothetical protein
MLAGSSLSDAGFAVWTGLVAAAVWTLLAFAWRRYRLRRALTAFVGSYEIHRKLHDEGAVGTAHIARDGDGLNVEYTEHGRGEAQAKVTLSERFPKSGRGTYAHRLPSDRLAWGTWDMELEASGGDLLVTTRYAHPEKQIEIVQGAEWRRTG